MKFTLALIPALLASAGSTAFAQSSVTVYGTIDAMAARLAGPAAGINGLDRATTRLDGGGLTTSMLGFRGTEDLGDGLTAVFDLSTFIRNDVGTTGRSDAVGPPVNVAADPFFSRSSWVGLASPRFGRVRMGNITTLLFFNSITTNAFGDSTVFGPLNLVTHIGGPQAGGTGWTNSIVYDSPALAGVTFSVGHSLSENQGGGNSSARIAYTNGPLAASGVWQSVKKNPSTFADGTTTNNVKTWMVGGSYDFKVVKVYAHLGGMQNGGTETAPQDVTYRIGEVSVSAPIGQGLILAGYALRKTSDSPAPSPATAAGGNKKRQVLTAGYDHYLSKRTDIYVLVMRDETATRTLPAPFSTVSASGTSYGFGVRHRF